MTGRGLQNPGLGGLASDRLADLWSRRPLVEIRNHASLQTKMRRKHDMFQSPDSAGLTPARRRDVDLDQLTCSCLESFLA